MTSRNHTKFTDKRSLVQHVLAVSTGSIGAVVGFLFILATSASAQNPADNAKVETGKVRPPIFSIEVPGPASKSKESGSLIQENANDPQGREKAANQFFKDKQKGTISSQPKVKEASMRLSGSLCPACLKALALRFQKTAGVITATVELPSQMKASEVETKNEVGKLPRYAVATVTYDSKVLSLERIKDIVRTNDLAYWKVQVTDK